MDIHSSLTSDATLSPPSHSLQTSSLTLSPRLLAVWDETTWLNKAMLAPCAWNTNIVPTGIFPGADQVFLDLTMDWQSTYHWRSRSGIPKINENLFGAFHCTAVNAITNDALDNTVTPLIQLDLQGLRIGGQILHSHWITPWTIQWVDQGIERAHIRWTHGQITYLPGCNTGTAVVISKDGATEHWFVERARRVGGPGALPLFSPRRTRRAEPGELCLAPIPPVNRNDYTTPMAPWIPRPFDGRRRAPSWLHVFRGGLGEANRYHRITKWFRQERMVQQAFLTACHNKGTDCLSDEETQELLNRHRLPATLILGQSDLKGSWRDTMLRLMPDGTLMEIFNSDPPVLPGCINVDALCKEGKNSTPWLNQALWDQLRRGWPTPEAHSAKFAVILRVYSKTHYQAIGRWDEEFTKGVQPDAFPRMFHSPTLDSLPSLPYEVALRHQIPKPGRPDEFRHVLHTT